MSDEQREGTRRDEGEGEGATHDESTPPRSRRPDVEDPPEPLPLPGRVRPRGEASVPLPGERRPPLPQTPEDEPLRPADPGTVPLPHAPRTSGEEPEERVPLPRELRTLEPERAPPEPLRAPARWVQRPAETPHPGSSAAPPASAPEPARERLPGTPPPVAPESPPPSPPDLPRPPRPASELDLAGLEAAARARADEEERSYRSLVEDVEQYLADGYDLFGLVGYPQSGKSHALQALSKVMHGFDTRARARFREARAPGQTERWLFYYAFDDGRRKWVFVDVGGELYELLHSDRWSEETEATAGLLHTVAHCRGLLLTLHLQPGHLRHGAKGFAAKMSEAERKAERTAQTAQEELEFFDEFLLFARALRAERGNLDTLLTQAAAAPLAETLRTYQGSPRLDLPVAVLFTQADRLLDGRDFGAGRDEYVNPLTIHGVAPFVGRHMPSLLGSLLRHARRFRLDFTQSYIEGPGPGDGEPLWDHDNEPLSVGLLPTVEFLERILPPKNNSRPWNRTLETRTALRLHRLLHRRAWRDIEVEL